MEVYIQSPNGETFRVSIGRSFSLDGAFLDNNYDRYIGYYD